MSRFKKFFKKRPQLRRCAFCDKPGHNKSTCSVYLASLQIPTSTPAPIAPVAPIRFFVHHVAHEPIVSSHIINLKKDTVQAWHNVPTIEPEKNKNSQFENAYKKIKQDIHYQKSFESKDIDQQIFADISPTENITPIFVKSDKTESFEIKTELPQDNIIQAIQPQTIPEVTKPEKITTLQVYTLPKEFIKKEKFSWDFINNIKKYWQASWQGVIQDIIKIGNFIRSFIKENFVVRRLASASAILLLILVVPSTASSYYQNVILTKDKIAQDSTAGFLSLQNSTAALMQANLPTAQSAINDALNSFGTAVATMQNNHQLLQKIASVVPVLQDEVKSRQSLLLAGQQIAQGNTYLLDGIAKSQADASSTLSVRLDIILIHLNSAIPNYKSALTELNTVSSDSLPLAYQGPFKEFKIIFTAVLKDLQNLADLGESLKEIFGAQGQRRYLLIFQNSNELRPTGGFIGSMAIMDIKDGKILNLDVPAGGSYDLQGQLDQYVVPPTPLLLSNKRWEFQDANWFPDFSASAQKIMWFYRHSRNVTVDGVIAINATVLERLLVITGPITDISRGIIISANSALPTIQQVVENGPEKKVNKPKQILSDLAPQFIKHFQNSQSKDLLPLLVNLQDALTKKEIQAYFSDQSAQSAVEQMGWSGKILKTNSRQDYLAIFNTNIQGQKSDAKIKQSISHQALVQTDGSITDTITISRMHTGNAGEELYGVPNIDYIRVYVPKNSELISASGFTWPDENSFRVPENYYKQDEFLTQTEKEIKIDEHTGTEITNEFDKTAFGNWVITEPGQTSQIQFTYKLPFKLNDLQPTQDNSWIKLMGSKNAERYQLIVQKQSGINSLFESQIIFPSDWQSNYKEGEGIELAENGASIPSLILDTDRNWGVVMEK